MRFVFLAMLYLAFAAKLSWAELCLSALSAWLATAAENQLRKQNRQKLALLSPPLGWLARLLGSTATDGALVVAALGKAALRRVSGELRVVPFAIGGVGPRDAARRAWVTLGNSLSPNSLVIAIDRPHQRLLVHELVVKNATPKDPREWPL